MICAVRCRVPIMLNKNDYISLPVAIIANLLWDPLCQSGLRYLSCFACLGPSMHNIVYELSTWYFFSSFRNIFTCSHPHSVPYSLPSSARRVAHRLYKMQISLSHSGCDRRCHRRCRAAAIATSIILALSYYTTHLFWHEHAPNGKKV